MQATASSHSLRRHDVRRIPTQGREYDRGVHALRTVVPKRNDDTHNGGGGGGDDDKEKP